MINYGVSKSALSKWVKLYSTVTMDNGDVLTAKQIKGFILKIYSDFDKSIGAYKIQQVLECDYGISIDVNRVYRLMKIMDLPKMSTTKPKYKSVSIDNPSYINYFQHKIYKQSL